MKPKIKILRRTTMTAKQLAECAAPYNADVRELPPRQRKALRASLDEFGFVETVVFNERSGHIVSGHQRVALENERDPAAKIPTVVIDAAPKPEKKLSLALNGIDGQFVEDGLYDLFQSMGPDDDYTSTGFTDEEIAEYLGTGEDEPDDGSSDELPAKAPKKVKPGDTWLLGDHRLHCGDSLKFLAAAELGDVALVLADPPYGMNLDTDYSKMGKTTRGFAPIIGDDKPFDAAPYREILKGVGPQLWFGADYYGRTLGDTEHTGAWLVWDKRLTENLDLGFGSCFELIWSAQKTKRDILRHQWFQNHAEDSTEAADRHHPTQKPTSLLVDLLDRNTEQGDVVLDPFAGSGSTLIAAQKCGRTCIAIELDPLYCDIIIARWQTESGSKAKKAA